MPPPSGAALAHAVTLIKRFEGCAQRMPDGRLRAYPDPGTGGAPFTIGWGSTGPDIRNGTVWTQEQADARLAQEVAEKAAGVAALVTVPVSDAQLGALTSLAYNIGLGNVRSSTVLRKLNGGDVAGAADAFLMWTKAAGRELPGLVRRRQAERALFLTS